MQRSPLNLLITERVLHGLVGSYPSPHADQLIDKYDIPQMKNVCAKVSVELSDDIDRLCALLDVSKRVLLETAMQEIISEYKKVRLAEGLLASEAEGQ